jgi:hypothetical protein
MSGCDETDSNTQVHVARHTWVPMVLYYLPLNGPATRGSQLLVYLPGTGNAQAWLLGTRVHAEPGHKKESDWADMW